MTRFRDKFIPVVTNDDFTPFLRWLVEEKEYSTQSIINVVSEPYKYSLEYEEYINKEVV
tara:strand:- start:344 stop:520 length:177 start_codon:yes stop_codon:yes gene_type:complete